MLICFSTTVFVRLGASFADGGADPTRVVGSAGNLQVASLARRNVPCRTGNFQVAGLGEAEHDGTSVVLADGPATSGCRIRRSRTKRDYVSQLFDALTDTPQN